MAFSAPVGTAALSWRQITATADARDGVLSFSIFSYASASFMSSKSLPGILDFLGVSRAFCYGIS
jgi:hypothetical protein